MQLYTFWRSQAAFRVRIALALKGLEAQMVYVDLFKAAQAAPSYRELNPSMMLPTLIHGTGPQLVQSLAIIEYLDEVYADPPLLPKDPRDRAHVRALAHAMAIDAHPFVTPRVRQYLKRELHVDERGEMQWLQHWLDSASGVVEEMLTRDKRTGRFCFGNVPSLADICLIPHMTSAQMLYRCDFGPYPNNERHFRCVHATARVRPSTSGEPS